MLSSFARQPVTRLRPKAETDRYGKQTYTWTEPDSKDLGICVFQPVDTSETFDVQGDKLVARWRLAAPAGADLRAHDRLVVEGVTYDVDGDPMNHDSPSGRLAYTEAFAKKVGL